MSQNDYLQWKRTTTVLKLQNEMEPVLLPNDYTEFKQYALETTIPNTKMTFHRLLSPNHRYVLEMDRVATTCPTFIVCRNTNTRPNRKLHGVSIPWTTKRLNKVDVPLKFCSPLSIYTVPLHLKRRFYTNC